MSCGINVLEYISMPLKYVHKARKNYWYSYINGVQHEQVDGDTFITFSRRHIPLKALVYINAALR